MTTDPGLGVARRDGVLWLTLQREERRNALSAGVLAGLAAAIAAAQDDRELRAIVLTGAGDQAFCAGADLQAGLALDVSQPTGPFGRLLRQARASQLPLVALARLTDKSPSAIRRGLCTLKAIDALGFEPAMAFTESQIALFAQTEDAREGLAAFQQKRKPQWTGR